MIIRGKKILLLKHPLPYNESHQGGSANKKKEIFYMLDHCGFYMLLSFPKSHAQGFLSFLVRK